jgi:hypothetical protein
MCVRSAQSAIPVRALHWAAAYRCKGMTCHLPDMPHPAGTKPSRRNSSRQWQQQQAAPQGQPPLHLTSIAQAAVVPATQSSSSSSTFQCWPLPALGGCVMLRRAMGTLHCPCCPPPRAPRLSWAHSSNAAWQQTRGGTLLPSTTAQSCHAMTRSWRQAGMTSWCRVSESVTRCV